MNSIDNDRGPAPYSVLASAPVRTADVGGWSDTWFAEYGLVCNVAIEHRARVRVDVDPAAAASIELDVKMTGQRYRFDAGSAPGLHPMLEAAAGGLAPRCGVFVEISDTIDGSGLGTSSAVLVAVVAALTEAAGSQVEPRSIAAAAHRFETGSGREAGVQDHVAAAYGGVSLISVDYPRAHRRAVRLSAATLADLGRRMITVWFGHGHHSSSMHDEVISRLASGESSVALDRIRDAAHLAAEALTHADVDAYAAALTLNHRAMIDLHPSLISDEAHELSELAASYGAIGWKANGAAGPGGSMVLIGATDPDSVAGLRDAIEARAPWCCIDAPIASHGVIARRFSFDEHEHIDSAPDTRRTGDLA